MKTLAGFACIWGAYTLIWYGTANLMHLEVGIVDLIYPSRIGTLTALLAAGPSSGSGGSQATPAPQPGQPGVPNPGPSGGRGAATPTPTPGTVNGILV